MTDEQRKDWIKKARKKMHSLEEQRNQYLSQLITARKELASVRKELDEARLILAQHQQASFVQMEENACDHYNLED